MFRLNSIEEFETQLSRKDEVEKGLGMIKVFSIWRIVCCIGLARTGTWSNTTNNEKRIYLISMHILRKGGETGLCLIIGPLSLIIGFVTWI
jgi:hypothetical protein